MSLDLSKLENVRTRGDKIIAQCPACAESDQDHTCEHLIVDQRGRFGCVVYPGRGPEAKAHRRRIFELVGDREIKPLRVCVPLMSKNSPSVPSGAWTPRTQRTGSEHSYKARANVLDRLMRRFASRPHELPKPVLAVPTETPPRKYLHRFPAGIAPTIRSYKDRRYVLRDRDGDYVQSVEASETTTVKTHFTFTRDRAKAQCFTYDELWNQSSLAVEFDHGFSGSKAERVQ
jgi:hypothetical protein